MSPGVEVRAMWGKGSDFPSLLPDFLFSYFLYIHQIQVCFLMSTQNTSSSGNVCWNGVCHGPLHPGVLQWDLIPFLFSWEAVTALTHPLSPVAFGKKKKASFSAFPSECSQELYLLRVSLPKA